MDSAKSVVCSRNKNNWRLNLSLKVRLIHLESASKTKISTFITSPTEVVDAFGCRLDAWCETFRTMNGEQLSYSESPWRWWKVLVSSFHDRSSPYSSVETFEIESVFVALGRRIPFSDGIRVFDPVALGRRIPFSDGIRVFDDDLHIWVVTNSNVRKAESVASRSRLWDDSVAFLDHRRRTWRDWTSNRRRRTRIGRAREASGYWSRSRGLRPRWFLSRCRPWATESKRVWETEDRNQSLIFIIV